LYIGFDVFVTYSSYDTSLKMATKVAETCRRFTTLILQQIHITSHTLVNFTAAVKHQCMVVKYLKLI